MPSSPARRRSSPGMSKPVHETTLKSSTSLGETPAAFRQRVMVSHPSGSASAM